MNYARIHTAVLVACLLGLSTPADANGRSHGHRYGHGYGYGHGHGHGHHRRSNIDIVIDAPWWGRWYGYPSYARPYRYAPLLTVPAPVYFEPVPVAAPVYIERTAPAIAPAPQAAAVAPNPWYYCAATSAYYPYVKDCPSGWQAVSPTPVR